MSERVDHDRIAAFYGTRYERNDYAGVEQALAAFVAGERSRSRSVSSGLRRVFRVSS